MNTPLTSHPYTKKVRRYYDANTSIFALFEPKGDQTIHRAVWAPGVARRRAAIDYTNELVAAECERFAPLRIVDLGCGTGGTFLFLADRLPSSSWKGVAVTLSPLQVRRARESFERRGIADRCSVVEADYVAVPETGPFDVAVAVESFVHCPEPAAFFREVARLLAPGGRLLLCDDIRSERADTHPSSLTPSETACMREFERGWLAPDPQSVRSITRFASEAGLRLVSSTNLTPWLRLLPGRALVRPFLRLGGIDHPLLRSLTGGLALQLALGQGLLEYRWMTFERVGAP